MTLYQHIVLATAFAAGAITLAFLFLVLRRHVSERNRARRDKRDSAITRSYLQRVAGHKVPEESAWSRQARLKAISRILPLLRGGERTRLMQIAELDGVLRETLRISHSLFRARRINAIQSMQRFGSEVCIGRLREMMSTDNSQRVRLEAAFALAANGSLPPPREILRLLKALRRQPTRLDIALLRSAASVYPEQMLILLEDELPDAWRVQVIDALGWSEYMGAIDALDRASEDPDSEIRCAVMRASARLGHPAARRWIMMGLADRVPSVRLHAIAASVRLGLRTAVPAMTQLLHDPELWVRLRAEQALRQLAPAVDVPPQESNVA
ncbi:HEAT repeat domain-containing protein [Alteriqipengyuania lutimaris]|uniref:HEAT repeat domain-containing protein n=1 Tax=Alteriqipengyuania lutimaris TaxID=1538146 RepID=A0A395LS50_9SPHN|nr:HEAT repeat domain-containing protein [Alteriqipengyuania lutimaris]MBB3033603.1 HEAT repeat protein [Alteriqipengyuania lutimaris]RDS77400.1 HEAT repeat domain-containing protein [Alteriqipengyuania lutimaris]